MGTQPSVSSEKTLLENLARIRWYGIYEPYYSDHKLERTFLENQLGVSYVRKKDNPDQIYVTKEGIIDNLNCLKCGATVLKAQVAHPIRYQLLPLSFAEKCEHETVPYCPTCEEIPNPNGTPVGTSK